MADILFEDTPNCAMNWALISVIPSKKHPGKVAHKIRGVYKSREDADADAPRLQDEDNDHNTYVQELYKWVLLPPDDSKIHDVHYQEQVLNDIVRGAYKNRKDAKTYFEARKKQIIRDGLDAVIEKEEKKGE